MKMRIREKDSHRYARKSTTCPGIQDFCIGQEFNDFSYAQRMQDMSQVQIVNVFPGNNIDPGIPSRIKRTELLKLTYLQTTQIWKIVDN
jgi:hypothetical protein